VIVRVINHCSFFESFVGVLPSLEDLHRCEWNLIGVAAEDIVRVAVVDQLATEASDLQLIRINLSRQTPEQKHRQEP